MDVMEMKFRDGQFDVVVGKGKPSAVVCSMIVA